MRTWDDVVTCGGCGTEFAVQAIEHSLNQWWCPGCGALVSIHAGSAPALSGWAYGSGAFLGIMIIMFAWMVFA